MDNIITVPYATGVTLDLYIIGQSGSYALTGTNGIYTVQFPALNAGTYICVVRQRQGANASVSDPIIGEDQVIWNGSGFLSLLDINADIEGLGAGTVTVSSPVLDGGAVTIVAGDDYAAADDRALIWTLSNAPTLTGAAITLKLSPTTRNTSPNAASLTVSGSVLTGSGASVQVQVELTGLETSGLTVGAAMYSYGLDATLTNGHRVTLATGNVTVKGSS